MARDHPDRTGEAMREVLDEIEDLFPAHPDEFVRWYVQHEGNGGRQYLAAVDALVDRYGMEAVAELAEIVRRGVASDDFERLMHTIEARLGRHFADVVRAVSDTPELSKVLDTVVREMAATVSPVASVSEEERYVRHLLRDGKLGVARTAPSIGGGIVFDEVRLLLDSATADDDPDLPWLLGVWRSLAAANDDVDLATVVEGQESVGVEAGPQLITETARPPSSIRDETLVPKQRPDEKGDTLEGATIRLFKRLFSLQPESEETLLNTLRRQTAGSQFGHDIAFEATSRRFGTTRCHVECKHYARPIRLGDIADKLVQQDLYWAETPVHHWILVSPHYGAANELDLAIRRITSTQKYPFDVQIWSPDENVEMLFALEPVLYRRLYGEPPPELDNVESERIASAWAERLRPPVRIPAPLVEYVHNPSKLCLPGERHLEFDAIFHHHLTPRATDERGTPLKVECEQYVREWLARDGEPSLVILGEFGDGKSFFTYLLARRLNAELLDDPQNGWFVLRLALRGIRDAGSSRVLLERRLADLGATIGDWERVRTAHNTLVVLDGLDEMSPELDPETVSQNLRLIEDAARQFQGSKLLVTSRTGFLERRRDAERLSDRLGRPARIRLAAASRLRRVQHLDHYADRVGLRSKMDRLRRLYDPIGLAAKPLFLQMIKATLGVLPDDHFDEITLYKTYVHDSLHEKIELLREPDSEATDDELIANLVEILEEIAWELHRSGSEHLHLADFADRSRAGLASWLWRIGSAEPRGAEYDAQARVGVRSLLEPAPGDVERWPVMFFHRSMREYFVARRLLRAIRDGFAEAQALLTSVMLGPEVTQFAIALLREDEEAEATTTLLAVARSALRDLPGTGGGSALSLLYGLKKEVAGDDWSGLNLDAAVLPGANLQGKRFSNSSLRAAVLDNADLTNADFTNADLTGVRLEERASVSALSAHDGLIFAAYGDGTIRRWRPMAEGGPWVSDVVATRGQADRLRVMHVTPGGRIAAVGRFFELWEAEPASNEIGPLARFRLRTDVIAIDFSGHDSVAATYDTGHGFVSLVVDLGSVRASLVGPVNDPEVIARDGDVTVCDWLAREPGAYRDEGSDISGPVALVGTEISRVAVRASRPNACVVTGNLRGEVDWMPLTDDASEQRVPLGGHYGPVAALAIDEHLLVSGGNDGVVGATAVDAIDAGQPTPPAELTLQVECQGLRFDGVEGPFEREMLERITSSWQAAR